MDRNGKIAFILYLYRTFLQRVPMQSEVLFWLQIFDCNATVQRIRHEFMCSAEFSVELRASLRRRLGRGANPEEFLRYRTLLIEGQLQDSWMAGVVPQRLPVPGQEITQTFWR